MDWRKLSWKLAKPFAVKFIQSMLLKFLGLHGWVAGIAVRIIIKPIKSVFNRITRAIKKKRNQAKGEAQAEEILNAPTDTESDVDDVYDSMFK